MKTITLITTSILLSGSIISVVKAAAPLDVPTAVVEVRDLDKSRPAAKEELYRRLNQAARAVCSPVDPNGSVLKALDSPQYEACIDQALSNALAHLNRPDFTDYAQSRMAKHAAANIYLATR